MCHFNIPGGKKKHRFYICKTLVSIQFWCSFTFYIYILFIITCFACENLGNLVSLPFRWEKLDKNQGCCTIRYVSDQNNVLDNLTVMKKTENSMSKFLNNLISDFFCETPFRQIYTSELFHACDRLGKSNKFSHFIFILRIFSTSKFIQYP